MFKNFYIKDLFEVINNPQLDKENFTFSESAEYPYFTRTENNNGILGYVEYLDEEHKIKGNSLAVGMISMRFHYMYHDFYAGQFTKTLIPKFQGFNEKLAMYFMAILNKHSEYYQSFLVRHFKDKVSETVVSLPVVECPDLAHEYTVEDIDFKYMQERIAELEQDRIAGLEQERIAELDAYLMATGLDDYELTDEDKEMLSLSTESASSDEAGAPEADFGNGQVRFKKFALGDVFNIYSPKKRFNANKVQFNGKYPYVARGSSNNGIRGYITEDEKYLSPARSLSFGQDTATVFYQPDAYFTGDKIKVMVLNNHELNDELAQYFITVITKVFSTFAWGQNSFNEKILKATEIVLPVIESPDPDHDYTVEDIDFDYMERYIRTIEKLAIADVTRYRSAVIDATKKTVSV